MTGPELKSWRERLGLSRSEAAELLDMSVSYIEKAEVGKRGIHRTVEYACRWLEQGSDCAKAYEGE